MILLLYMLMIIGVPIIFCILLYKLRKKIPWGSIIIPILMGIIIFRTVIFSPIYIIGPFVTDSNYEFLQSFLLILKQFSIYGIIIIFLYIVSCIFMKKEIKFIISITAFTVIFTVLIYLLGGFIFKERERFDNLYLKMEEINVNNSLVGLSKGEVVELLGEPMEIYEYSNMDREVYTYSAGNIYVGIIWFDHNIATKKHFYILSVDFDETGKVKSTSMKEST